MDIYLPAWYVESHIVAEGHASFSIVSRILRGFQRFWTPMLRAWFFQLVNTPNNSPDCRGER
jgi:hypothetical protein